MKEALRARNFPTQLPGLNASGRAVAFCDMFISKVQHSAPQDMVAKPPGMHVKPDPWNSVLIAAVTASSFTVAKAFWPEKWSCTYYLRVCCTSQVRTPCLVTQKRAHRLAQRFFHKFTQDKKDQNDQLSESHGFLHGQCNLEQGVGYLTMTRFLPSSSSCA